MGKQVRFDLSEQIADTTNRISSTARKSKLNAQSSKKSSSNKSASTAPQDPQTTLDLAPKRTRARTTEWLFDQQLRRDDQRRQSSRDQHWEDFGDADHASELSFAGLERFPEEARQGSEWSEMMEFIKEKQSEPMRGDPADDIVGSHDRARDSDDSTVLGTIRGRGGSFTSAATHKAYKSPSQIIEEVRLQLASSSIIHGAITRSAAQPNQQEDLEKLSIPADGSFMTQPEEAPTLHITTELAPLPPTPDSRTHGPANAANYPTARLRNQGVYLVYTQTKLPYATDDLQQIDIDSIFTTREAAMNRAVALGLPLLPPGQSIEMSVSSTGHKGWRIPAMGGSVVNVFVQDATLNPEGWMLERQERSRRAAAGSEATGGDAVERVKDFLTQPLDWELEKEEDKGLTEKPSDR